MKYVITIDPGKGGSGFAVWDYTKWKEKNLHTPIEYGIIRNKKIKVMLTEFDKLLIQYYPTDVYIEDAAYMSGDARTQATARSGKLVILAEFIGQIMMLCIFNKAKFHLISVAKWKGTLSKNIVARRVYRKLPRVDAKSHAMDAVGLGLYLQGHINQ